MIYPKIFNRVLLICVLLCVPFSLFAQQFTGTWQKKSYDIKGTWSIEHRDDGDFIVFDKNFKTRSGPDLKIYLSKTQVKELSDNNVESTSEKISPLKSNKGAQEYKIPHGINLDQYNSLVIHCEKYSHLWGGADFSQ